jgi:hypothetical protein
MKVDMYIDVDVNFLKNMQAHGVYATSLPMKMYEGNGTRRFRFTVNIPDEAVYGRIEYASISEQEEVVS